MSDGLTSTAREAELERLEAPLSATADNIDIRFRRCCLLAELGRLGEAKSAYLELLRRVPTHFGALTNLGNLVYAQGYKTAAKTLYVQAIASQPDSADAHVNLGNLLIEAGEVPAAREQYETALRADPDHREAHRGMAYLLTRARDETQAAIHREKAFRGRPLVALPYHGSAKPIRVLMLVSAYGGTSPLRRHLDPNQFQVSALFAEYYEPSTPLPPHDLVVNAIGDVDLCQRGLEAAEKIVAQTDAPAINHPARVLQCGRTAGASRLRHSAGIITPKMFAVRREQLQHGGAAELLGREGFAFPLLLRSPGFHNGQHFVRVENPEEIEAALPELPGDELLAIQYLDARSDDGKIRKYRVMIIDGTLYPVHAAISHQWKIHYSTAEMADQPEHGAEDAAFLEDMPRVLGQKAIDALRAVGETLALDYAGIDFSLDAEGNVLLFEANATMVVHAPDPDARWDYRRPAIQRVLDAIRRMLIKRAHTGPDSST